MASAIRLSQIILSKMPKLSHTTVSSLYAKAIGGKLKDSPVIRETILFLKRAPSDMLVQIMEESLSLDVLRKDDVSTQFYFSAHVELKSLLKDIEMNDGALRSEFDVRNDTLRTTVVAKKVELSKQKATLSKNDAAYSKLLQDFVQRFESYLNSSLFNPGNMMFLEISTYDIKQPTRASFAPKIRFAIERALSSPHDYLNCDCCKASEKEDEVRSPSLLCMMFAAYLSP